ncbi:hypothetical protein K3495_g12192 [Podosphaera aphanis]|nr:hypothetical protein K3495_g12192 [Podosphaera aphanis]
MEKESARVAMRILEEKFVHETTTSTLELFNKLIGLEMEEGESLVDHLSRLEAASNTLSHDAPNRNDLLLLP